MSQHTKTETGIAVKLSIMVGLVGTFVAVLAAAVSCGGSAAPIPTNTPRPADPLPAGVLAVPDPNEERDEWRRQQGLPPMNPDGTLADTAEAPAPTPASASKRAPAPTPTPTPTLPPVLTPYTPSFWDYKAAIQPQYRYFDGPFRGFAMIYAASECVSGRELSSDGFHAYIRTFESGLNIKVRGKEVIGQMLALSATGAKLDCLRPYLYPKTAAEATLAVDLVIGTMLLHYFAIDVHESQSKAIDGAAYHWLGEEAHQKPLLEVVALRSSLLLIEVPVQVTAPTNTRGLYPPAWAVERELSMVRERIGSLEYILESLQRR